MPQADLLTFRPTLVVLPLTFLVGYFFFATYWVPRIHLTLKARHWLLGAFPVTPQEGWPELFLMFVQFGALLFFIQGITLVTPPTRKLTSLVVPPRDPVTLDSHGGAPLENLLFLWGTHRGTLFFAPAALEVTHLVERVLGGFTFFVPSRQFPILSARLRVRLGDQVSSLPETPRG